MATRRMFSQQIIGSARFLRMPSSARLLYYDLGMAADDDGVVEAFAVMRTTGASEDDLRVLAAKQFVTIMNDDLVAVIMDWKVNNIIRSDRYHPSIYKDMVVRLTTENISDFDNQLTPIPHPSDNQMETEVRLGKVRLGKVRLGEDIKPVSAARKPPSRHKYGEYQNVLLSDEELKKLQEEFPDWKQRIERLSSYIAQSGKSYKSHLAVIRNWARRDADNTKAKTASAQNYQQHQYTDEDFGDEFFFDPMKEMQ